MEEKIVLCVIDVQNDFITGSLANEEAQKKVPNIVEKINSMTPENCDHIFVTMDTHNEDYLKTKEGEKLPFVHCVKDTEGWQLAPTVAEAIKNAEKRGVPVRVFKKPTFGSVAMGVMTALLTRDGIKRRFEFVGFCTDICVVSNALMVKANVYENCEVDVIENCCAGVTPESHEAALTTMKMCQINII